MHRQLYTQCRLELELTAVSPLLVQGEQGQGEFYKAIDPADGREKYCIPATSLKGVWRSAAERILRTAEEELACDPFEERADSSQSCAKRLEGKQYDSLRDTAKIYACLCPACRLFGSTAHAGVIALRDGWVATTESVETRTGIAIDRFTGGVKHGALYTVTPLSPGISFTINVEIANFEFWHLGLLALVCREMDEGRIRLGSGTRRGLGHVRTSWRAAHFVYPNLSRAETPVGQAGSLASAQSLAVGDDRIPYPDDEKQLLAGLQPQPATGWRERLWTSYQISGDSLDELRAVCVGEALAPKLRKGRKGFALCLPEGEA